MRRKLSQSNAGDLLIIGYGNELRSDDGVGPKVAKIVARWGLPGVRIIGCHQLMPELVVSLATAGQVVFVDAAKGPCSIRAQAIKPVQSAQVMTHAVDPGTLLRLTKVLYERCPTALSLTIPAEDFSFGRRLSEVCRKGMRAALGRLRTLATERRKTVRHGQKRTNECQQRLGGISRRTSL